MIYTYVCVQECELTEWIAKSLQTSKNFYVFLSLLCLAHFQVQPQILTPIYVVIGNYSSKGEYVENLKRNS